MEDGIMEAMKLFEKKPKVHMQYDEEADVLCLAFQQPRPALGIDIGEGVVLRFDEKKKEVVGLTILGVRGKLADYLKQKAA
jgi:uncharacterized protein YuzE